MRQRIGSLGLCLKRVYTCSTLSGGAGIRYWDRNWCDGKDALAIKLRAFIKCQVIIAIRDACGYRPVKMLNSAAAFTSQEALVRYHRHIDICLGRNEVDLQRVVACSKARARETGRGRQLSVAGNIHSYVNGGSGMARIEGTGAVDYSKTICERLAVDQLTSNEMWGKSEESDQGNE